MNDDLKNDKNIVMAAIKNGSDAMEYASNDLKCSIDFAV